MEKDFTSSKIDVRDLVQVLMMLTIEIMAAILPSKEADTALEQVASRLIDASTESTDERNGLLLRALAYQLMGTEQGA